MKEILLPRALIINLLRVLAANEQIAPLTRMAAYWVRSRNGEVRVTREFLEFALEQIQSYDEPEVVTYYSAEIKRVLAVFAEEAHDEPRNDAE